MGLKDRLVIGVMVGSMVFSVFGTGLIIWLSSQTSIPEPIFSELGITDVVEGEGEAVDDVTDIVTVNYRGTLASTGAEFDSSYEGGEPISFSLGGVIPGWTEGLIGMKVGGTRQLEIPSDLAYGATGAGASIPPYSDLIFDIELLEIENVDPEAEAEGSESTETEE